MDEDDTSTLGACLRDGSLYERAPVALHAQIRANLRAAAQPRPRASMRAWRDRLRARGMRGVLAFGSGGFAGALLCAFAFAFVVMPMTAEHPDLLMRDIISSHVRAMLSDRAIDVVSTDRHTVKPWFSGRLDYAPPVVDTAAQGFPLVGGRLDYVAQRPVAVMIYGYLKHSIDLYVFPDAHDVRAPPQARTEAGFSIARWHQNGMTFCAITDASPAFLKEFEQAIQAEVGR
ncbi:anti-sigma factor family protein [Pararobbsia silviterrae]|uniref:Anti-sigma factor n=1 Tax=Pararobbsia silviterrae TaxID=1792498 RepID=A0A494Y5U2_9BURK|nr:anti-sigma factor [Pararobbsia silviterrae]RKP55696.1 anti-sigma factor [Pararobbsia silviterrae]